jgi:hypothetical protein
VSTELGALDDLLNVLGYPGQATVAVKLTGGLTGDGPAETPQPDSNSALVDRVDRLDRQKPHITELVRGRFEVGRQYRTSRVDRVFRLPSDVRAETDLAGLTRAGAVEVEGVHILIADVARLFIDGVFLVVGFYDPATDDLSQATREGQINRSSRSSRSRGP